MKRPSGFLTLGFVVVGIAWLAWGCGGDSAQPFGDDGTGGRPFAGTGGRSASGSGGRAVGSGGDREATGGRSGMLGGMTGSGGNVSNGGGATAASGGRLGATGGGGGAAPNGTGGRASATGGGSGSGGRIGGGSGGGGGGSTGGGNGSGGSAIGSGGRIGSGGAASGGGTYGSGGVLGSGGRLGTGGSFGTGGDIGVPTTCDELAMAYSDEIPNAKVCPTLSKITCAIKVARSLGCQSGCPTYVQDATRLNEIAAKWESLGCDRVLRICPAILCVAVTGSACRTGSIFVQSGTCVDTSDIGPITDVVSDQ